MKAFILACLCLALAGCNTVTQQKVETTINEAVPIACAGIDVAWTAFEAYKAVKPVKADLTVKAQAAYFAAKDVCASPPTDGATALIAVLKASTTFNNAIRAAKNDQSTGAGG